MSRRSSGVGIQRSIVRVDPYCEVWSPGLWTHNFSGTNRDRSVKVEATESEIYPPAAPIGGEGKRQEHYGPAVVLKERDSYGGIRISSLTNDITEGHRTPGV